jgi:uncharacterized protein
MPRKKKLRCCRCHVKQNIFKPVGIPLNDLEIVNLGLDEFEAVRLCDYDGLTQEEAGIRMGISRATVQRLLYSARNKMVEVILTSKALRLGYDD